MGEFFYIAHTHPLGVKMCLLGFMDLNFYHKGGAGDYGGRLVSCCNTLLHPIFVVAGVEVVPGSEGPVKSVAEAINFCEQYGLPVIFKAAYGGGGRGMRKVTTIEVSTHIQYIYVTQHAKTRLFSKKKFF